MKRRDFLAGTAALTAGVSLPAAALAGTEAQRPFFGLVESLPDEKSYRPRVEGRIPEKLRGTLYRNGPGLFERDGHRLRCLLDGDGMVQAFTFDDVGVHYQTRFVRTAKYERDEREGRFVGQSWTTPAPGGWIANLGVGDFPHTSGVNAQVWAGKLYALEDANPAHRMDPDSLATEGLDRFGLDRGTIFSAHPKQDRRRRDWVHFGLGVGSRDLSLTTLDAAGRVTDTRRFEIDQGSYTHDFFVSDRHIIFSPNPTGFHPLGLLVGTDGPAGCLRWNDPAKRDVYVFTRDGTEPPIRLEAPPSWMWHSLNAFERDGEIVCDFIGYDAPDHFIGDSPSFWAIMEGRHVELENGGKVRRWRIDPQRRRLREEVLRDAFNEYPTVHPGHLCGDYRYAWMASVRGPARGHPWNGVERMDLLTGDVESHFFGENQYLANGESVFAPRPGATDESDGWLLSLVYDHDARRSHLAILRADAISEGPVARVLLDHHTPLSFHGSWEPTGGLVAV